MINRQPVEEEVAPLHRHVWVLLFVFSVSVLLISCSPDPQSCSPDQAQLAYGSLTSAMDEFARANEEVGALEVNDRLPGIQNLKTIRDEASSLRVPRCALFVKQAQLDAMDATIAAQEKIVETGGTDATTAALYLATADTKLDAWMAAIEELGSQAGGQAD